MSPGIVEPNLLGTSWSLSLRPKRRCGGQKRSCNGQCLIILNVSAAGASEGTVVLEWTKEAESSGKVVCAVTRYIDREPL